MLDTKKKKINVRYSLDDIDGMLIIEAFKDTEHYPCSLLEHKDILWIEFVKGDHVNETYHYKTKSGNRKSRKIKQYANIRIKGTSFDDELFNEWINHKNFVSVSTYDTSRNVESHSTSFRFLFEDYMLEEIS